MLSAIRDEDEGFTLIELLVVILIIGILAAIALPAFLSQRGKAQDTDAKSMARTVQTAFETVYTDQQSYKIGGAAATAAGLHGVEPAIPDDANVISAVTSDDSSWSVTVKSKTGNTFTVAKDANGNVTHTCVATTSKGGCPDSVYTAGP